MNKLVGSILVVALLLVTASSVLAAAPIEGCDVTHDIDFGPGYGPSFGATSVSSTVEGWGMVCLLETIYTVTDWIFYGLLSLVSVFTVYGGFLILRAGQDEENLTKGRNYVLYATVGLIVAFLSRVIPSIAEGVVG